MATESSWRNFGLREKAQLMSASEMQRTLLRLAHEIVEKNDGVDGLGWWESAAGECRWRSASAT
jgi:pyrimidine operon attenuation protein/uracil phosphoribosyltransferase